MHQSWNQAVSELMVNWMAGFDFVLPFWDAGFWHSLEAVPKWKRKMLGG